MNYEGRSGEDTSWRHSQIGSNPVKPDQTKSNLRAGLSSASLRRRLRVEGLVVVRLLRHIADMPLAFCESKPVKPDQIGRGDCLNDEKGTQTTKGSNGTNLAGSSLVKVNQTKSNGGGCGIAEIGLVSSETKRHNGTVKLSPTGVTQVRAENNTIISEMLMLGPEPKLHSVGLIKPNQTKSNLRGGKKCRFQGSWFKIQWSNHQNTRRRQIQDDHSFRESTLVR